ncbi:hypothetical protein Meth11DRAFT_0481 [Methylophilaceae bacterium 11]|jgi:DNA polymerase|nr:hypothetical protein Meth11DRAFT_0481 [Methylophilaceae bacterium 11]
MSVTREDIFRELELLPVWQLNSAQVAAPRPVSQSIATPKVADVPEPPQIILPPEIETPHSTLSPVSAEPPLEKVAVTWLLYCPLPDANIEAPASADMLTLLKNMINAMQLLSTDYQLVHDEQVLLRYQPEYALLFGLAAANTFLGTQAPDVETLGNQPVLHAQSNCWVIDHPADLLQTPMLKRNAWRVMCDAKAYATQKNTQ